MIPSWPTAFPSQAFEARLDGSGLGKDYGRFTWSRGEFIAAGAEELVTTGLFSFSF
jgi:hypothetical protein